jgi:hypothetical protein
LSPLPGNSLLLGIPLLFVAAVYTCGVTPERLETRWHKKTFACHHWRPYLPQSQTIVDKIEKLCRQRWPFFLFLHNRFFAGLALCFLAFVITLPIPFINIPACIGIIFLALGGLQRDGLMLFAGHVIAAGHLIAGIYAKEQVIDWISLAIQRL